MDPNEDPTILYIVMGVLVFAVLLTILFTMICHA